MGAELDELAEAPPSAFVRTRQAIVARLRKAGRAREAAEVARRRRPSPVLWLANRLAQTDRSGIERLVGASDRLRRAQLRDPRAIREATAEHRGALSELMRRAERLMREAGMRATHDVGRRVQATLTAAAADRRLHPALRRGHLSAEIEPGGFEVLGEVPARHLKLVKPDQGRKASPPPRVSAKERRGEERRQREAARREAQAQRREAARRQAEAARRQRTIDHATRQAERLREQLQAAEARLQRARLADGQRVGG